MILDAEKGLGHDPPRYDLCIVGAGPAGITLALELEATGLRVCLLEAGGTAYQADSQRLFEGEVVASQYPVLRDTRLGAFGGSTHEAIKIPLRLYLSKTEKHQRYNAADDTRRHE